MNDSLGLVGTTIEGRYRIDAAIDVSELDVVYRGEHLRLEQPIAIKCLRFPERAGAEARQAARARFRERGRLMLKLEAPGLLRVLDFGLLGGDREIPYLVMEWLEGETLATRLSAGPLEPAELRVVCEQLFAAMIAAHGAGVAHGRLRPERVLLARRPGQQTAAVKLLGTGFESVLRAIPRPPLTLDVDPWRAPEAFDARGSAEPAQDVWSLALLVFTCWTGKPFWKSAAADTRDVTLLAKEILIDPIPAPSERAAELGGRSLPPELDAVLARALVRTTDGEPRIDAAELWEVLRPLLGDEPEPTLEPLLGDEPEPELEPLRGNPKGSHYDDGLAGPPSSGDRTSDELLRGNPKGSHYDSGLQRPAWRPWKGLALLTIVAAILWLALRALGIM